MSYSRGMLLVLAFVTTWSLCAAGVVFAWILGTNAPWGLLGQCVAGLLGLFGALSVFEFIGASKPLTKIEVGQGAKTAIIWVLLAGAYVLFFIILAMLVPFFMAAAISILGAAVLLGCSPSGRKGELWITVLTLIVTAMTLLLTGWGIAGQRTTGLRNHAAVSITTLPYTEKGTPIEIEVQIDGKDKDGVDKSEVKTTCHLGSATMHYSVSPGPKTFSLHWLMEKQPPVLVEKKGKFDIDQGDFVELTLGRDHVLKVTRIRKGERTTLFAQ